MLKNWLLKYLLCTVTADDIISILQNKSGQVVQLFIGKEKITNNEWRGLNEEAKFIVNTRLWSIITNSLAEQAKIRMFESSKNDADMMFGKAMLYCIDTQKKLIEKIKQYNGEA